MGYGEKVGSAVGEPVSKCEAGKYTSLSDGHVFLVR